MTFSWPFHQFYGFLMTISWFVMRSSSKFHDLFMTFSFLSRHFLMTFVYFFMHFSCLYMTSSWLSLDFFMTFLGLSLDFLITFAWLFMTFYDFFMTSSRISHYYLLPFYDFLMTFLWLLMTFSWLSCDFLKTLRRNKLVLLLYYFSLHRPSEPIQSLSSMSVSCVSVFLCYCGKSFSR